MTTMSLMRLAAKLKSIPDTGASVPSKRQLQHSIVAGWQRRSQDIIAINPKLNASATCIFCHGLGDTGDGWAAAFEQEIASRVPWIKFLFPTALSIPVTLNGGMHMPAWYDIATLDRNRLAQDAPGMFDSVLFLQSLGDVEIGSNLNNQSQRLVFAGFSQGGALSLSAAHTYETRIGGVASLSAYLTARPQTEEHWQETNSDTPLLMCHGMQDNVVPFSVGKESFDVLVELKNKRLPKGAMAPHVRFDSFRMSHTSCPEEMDIFIEFLHRAVPPLTG